MLKDEGTLVLIVGQEFSDSIEIDAGSEVWAVRFTPNSEYLVTRGWGWIRVWRVKDGKQVAMMKADGAWGVAVSKDGRFIAAGSQREVLVWDATTHEQVFAGHNGVPICDVDFSPNSTRLISADSLNNTATIWDVAARKGVRTLNHSWPVLASKYSPQGDRIATVTSDESVGVWDSDDGRLLVNVKGGLSPFRGLLWFNNYLFVKTKVSTIKKIDASTGSTISEWSVPRERDSRIALPQHGQFLAYSIKDNITFWDTSTHIQLGLVSRSSSVCSITFSPSGQRLAFVQDGNIIIKNLSRVKVRRLVNRFPFLILISYQGAGHPYWKSCARGVEKRSTRQCGSITDCSTLDVRGYSPYTR